MSVILQPQKHFTVVRQIANHLDSGTYYVRAVIRDAYTDDILETLALSITTNQRYKGNWHVCPDTSGEGRYVSIVTSVYTDSGYTTKSENYGDEENTYLVQNRVPLGRGAGGGSVDYTRIRDIVQEELEKKVKEPEKIDYKKLKPKDHTDRTDEILAAISTIDIKAEKLEKKETDLSPVLSALQEVKAAIAEKEVTEPTDLAPLLQRIDEKIESDTLDHSEVKDTLAAMENFYRGLAADGTTEPQLDRMQTRGRLYEVIGYHDYEALDASIVKSLLPKLDGA